MTPYENRPKYVPTYPYSRRNAAGEEIDHKEDPSKVFDSAIENFYQDLVNDMFENIMDVYCSADLLRSCIDKDEIAAIRKYADEISEILKPHTSDRLSVYSYMPFGRH